MPIEPNEVDEWDDRGGFLARWLLWEEDKNEWRETQEAIRLFGLPWVLYARFIYRRHMRLIHRLGRHWRTRFPEPYPPDGKGDMLWCQWCGDRKRAALSPSHRET